MNLPFPNFPSPSGFSFFRFSGPFLGIIAYSDRSYRTPICDMLKALELAGFKSFADKTRFEFPAGITVVVGPNGSGKSNVVDAIKWVLGEQSIKSLRGKEMANVIFNGSPTRRPMNTAEITLTFNNTNRLLPIDTPEVHITRRIYRSGEGEYLINRNPSRLRDIRDLLAGTGLGTQAYSVIEQGKVDVLLQSSAKDRRMIFEEAAGISRFKLKKVEALRRLERVDQNLLRLADIVDEVESRLRSVRAQAGKARRYKEHTDRLQELRTQVGLVDWRRLSERLAEAEGRIRELTADRDAVLAAAEATDARMSDIDSQTVEINEEVRRGEAQIAANRERIAAQESSIEHERNRGKDLDNEIERHRRQVVSLSAAPTTCSNSGGKLPKRSRRPRTASHHRPAARRRRADVHRTHRPARSDARRARTASRGPSRTNSAAATLGNEISGLENQVATTAAARERSRGRMADLDRQIAVVAEELDGLRRQRDELARTCSRTRVARRRPSNSLPRSSANWRSAKTNWPPCGSGGAARRARGRAGRTASPAGRRDRRREGSARQGERMRRPGRLAACMGWWPIC